MNVQLLITAVVRQVTVLIAQLATSGGARAPLADVANQVFVDLASELEHQGIGRKVSADMFGMALRSYQRKLQRLTESSTVGGTSLWQAIFDYMADKKVASRAQVLRRFHRDDDAIVRGVLHDLTQNRLLFRAGSGDETIYRVATDDDLGGQTGDSDTGLDSLVWLTVYREAPVTFESLEKVISLETKRLEASLARLLRDSRIELESQGGADVYLCAKALRGFEDPIGWEAALFDHVQAIVKTIGQKLQSIDRPASLGDAVGASTYTFEVWSGHPLYEEVRTQLRQQRERLSALRKEVDSYNEDNGFPEEYERVVVYAGQHIIEQHEDDE